MTTYIDPILKKYVDLIQSNTNIIKKFYYGDPIKIPQSFLPALIISKVDSRISTMSNKSDLHDVGIMMTIVAGVSTEIKDETSFVPGTNLLYNIIEGRNDDYTLKDESIINIIRENVELDVTNNLRTDLGSDTSVDYGIREREENKWTVEGTISIRATFNQIR